MFALVHSVVFCISIDLEVLRCLGGSCLPEAHFCFIVDLLVALRNSMNGSMFLTVDISDLSLGRHRRNGSHQEAMRTPASGSRSGLVALKSSSE